MVYGALAAALLVAGLVWRARYLGAMTQLSLRHRQIGPDGIAVGAESFTLERAGAPAVLLIHGGGDTPQTMRYLAEALYADGFHVSAPLLPGHGRRIQDFARITADELTAAVFSSYRLLRREHEWTSIIGLSMGGALAVQVAAATPDLPALGLIAPYLAMPTRIAVAARWSWLWGLLLPAVRSGEGASVLDPTERERSLAYGVFTAAGLRALRTTVRRATCALPRVKAATLVVQSREDNRIAVADTERAFARLGSTEKRLDWITGAAHIITVDYGRERVIASLSSWMRQHLSS